MPVMQANSPSLVHIRVDGQSRDVPLAELDLSDAAGTTDVKRAVARYLGLREAQLADHVVDRHETGNFTVRPQAVFG